MIRGKKNRDLGRVDRAFLGSIGNPGEARPINARLETESRASSLLHPRIWRKPARKQKRTA
jgi:hypothetical protein